MCSHGRVSKRHQGSEESQLSFVTFQSGACSRVGDTPMTPMAGGVLSPRKEPDKARAGSPHAFLSVMKHSCP